MQRQQHYWIAGAGVVAAVVILLATTHSSRLRAVPPLSFFTQIASPVTHAVVGAILPPAINGVQIGVSVRESPQAQLQVFFGGANFTSPFVIDLASVPPSINCSTQVSLPNAQQAQNWSFQPAGTCYSTIPATTQGIRLGLVGAPGSVVNVNAGEWTCWKLPESEQHAATGTSITLPQSWVQAGATVDCRYYFHLAT